MVSSLRFPHQNLVHTSPFLLTCHMPRPSHSSRFYHPHNIGWGVRIFSLLCDRGEKIRTALGTIKGSHAERDNYYEQWSTSCLYAVRLISWLFTGRRGKSFARKSDTGTGYVSNTNQQFRTIYKEFHFQECFHNQLTNTPFHYTHLQINYGSDIAVISSQNLMFVIFIRNNFLLLPPQISQRQFYSVEPTTPPDKTLHTHCH